MELHGDGLVGALRELASRTKDIAPDSIAGSEVKSSPVIHDRAAQIHLYRIAQEAVRNAIRHGKARQIAIGLKTAANRIVLSVRDNGVGFPPDRREGKGLGLRIMEHRAGVLGGSMLVRKSHKAGTTVVCSIPGPLLKPPSRHDA